METLPEVLRDGCITRKSPPKKTFKCWELQSQGDSCDFCIKWIATELARPCLVLKIVIDSLPGWTNIKGLDRPSRPVFWWERRRRTQQVAAHCASFVFPVFLSPWACTQWLQKTGYGMRLNFWHLENHEIFIYSWGRGTWNEFFTAVVGYRTI